MFFSVWLSASLVDDQSAWPAIGCTACGRYISIYSYPYVFIFSEIYPYIVIYIFIFIYKYRTDITSLVARNVTNTNKCIVTLDPHTGNGFLLISSLGVQYHDAFILYKCIDLYISPGM